MKQLLILVYYINVDGLTSQQVNRIISEYNIYVQFSDEFQNDTNTIIKNIIIPVINQNTKVEVVYPKVADDNEKILDILTQISEKMKNVI